MPKNLIFKKKYKIFLQNVFLKIFLRFFLIKLHNFEAKPEFFIINVETRQKIIPDKK